MIIDFFLFSSLIVDFVVGDYITIFYVAHPCAFSVTDAHFHGGDRDRSIINSASFSL